MDEREARGHEIGVSNHVVKVIEVLAESPDSWEDAARVALKEASRSLHDITSIYVKDMQAVVRDGHVTAWRVNAKVSFVVDDRNLRRAIPEVRGGTTMPYRQRENVREGNYRPTRNQDRNQDSSFPDYDEYGLHGDDRRQYRGRESYEQQTRGGEGGRSGMWDHRFVPRDLDEPYRNNADEDRRGYQNISSRDEFESSGRGRPDYAPRWRDDAPRFGFDAEAYARRDPGGASTNRAYPAPHSPRGMYYGEHAGQRRTGRGPKGYKRSDDRIREDVCDRLSQQWDVDASDVEVTVANGEVTLAGTISDRDQKFRIEHIADGVGGVNEVHNQLRVRRDMGVQSTATPTSQTARSATNPSRSS